MEQRKLRRDGWMVVGGVWAVGCLLITPAGCSGKSGGIKTQSSDRTNDAITTDAPQSARTGEASVKPGINDSYQDVQVDEWVDRFEREDREVYENRQAIMDYVAPKTGAAIADIGAGTGFFSMMFADRVGPNGLVYAVDIVPEFLERIDKLAADRGFGHVDTILCTEDSVELEPESVDLAFICDTYHHFEYPRSTMATVYDAVRPGGELIVIDFDRVPGVSREWILDHVRAGREVFTQEIESHGFDLVDTPRAAYLKENYILRFQKPSNPWQEANRLAPPIIESQADDWHE